VLVLAVMVHRRKYAPMGIASPVMANLALDGLEKLLQAHYPPNTKRAQRAKVPLVRYAADFLSTGSSPELLAHEVTPLVEQFLRTRGLELSPTKTHRTSIEDGFDFLGQHRRKYARKRLIKPARKSVQTFLGHIREMVKANKQTPAGHLMAQLNPVIRGWANYHRHVVSKATFIKVDTAICKNRWSWATRRPPKKSGRWVAKKYFRTRPGRQWTFVGTDASQQGQSHELALLRAGDVPIQRHVKVKGTANPYDPQWEVYFEERLGVKMAHTLKGRWQLLYLWKHQHGLCPLCHQKSTRLTGWHNHHVIWRTYGGRDTTENRVLLHPNCHRQVHSQPLDVAPSRSARSV
jgi:RNA-directed DNA polymerase